MARISTEENSFAKQPPVFNETDEFAKDIKKLKKKYGSICEDLEVFKSALITSMPAGLPGIFQITYLGESIEYPVYKLKNSDASLSKEKERKVALD
jgi:hypothetical protein